MTKSPYHRCRKLPEQHPFVALDSAAAAVVGGTAGRGRDERRISET